jgi:hypothetical protein
VLAFELMGTTLFRPHETMRLSTLHFSARHFGKPVLAVCMVLLFSKPADAHKTDLPIIIRGETAAGHAYMIGGLAFDDREAMERQSAPYNLKLVFAPWFITASEPVLLLIGDNQGRRIEKLKLHAPWFYIRLPSGGYTIIARIKEAVILIRDVYLHENHRATYFLRPR